MKEMRLFEVGFKDKPTFNRDSSYEYIINVGADNVHEAEEKARLRMEEETNAWGKDAISDGEITREDFNIEFDRIKNLYLAKVLDVGTLIV